MGANKSKKSLIKKEKARLEKIFNGIAPDKKILCEKLIGNAAFMAITLELLQEDINLNGPVITGINGNGFEVTSENPAQKSYNTMINRYGAVIKQLEELLPDDKTNARESAGEALAAFVAKGKPGGK